MRIQGKWITLRTAATAERKRIYEMGLSTDYMKQCFLKTFANGVASFEQDYIEEYFDDKEPYVRAGLMICLKDIPIGFISYGQICNFSNREWLYHFGTMELDIWMDGEENCGKGYGVDAVKTLTDYLYKTYNISRFMICPERINPRAVHAYKKAGFREVAAEEKTDVLLEIFNQQGFRRLNPDDAYLSEGSCFMIKKYGAMEA